MRVSLDHAHIFATDVEATLAFFVSMFDADVLWDEEAAGVRGVRIRIGGAFIHIYDQPPRAPKGGVVHHLGIETDDLETLVSKMKAQGFAFRNEIKAEPRFKYVMVAGPDNLLIELFECNEPARWGLSNKRPLRRGAAVRRLARCTRLGSPTPQRAAKVIADR